MRVRNVTVSFLAAATILMAETAQERKQAWCSPRSWAHRKREFLKNFLGRAHCIVIIPGMKSGAIGIGGKYGRVTP